MCRSLLRSALMLSAVLAALSGCGAAEVPESVQVTFRVQVPPETPADASVSVAGSAAELGNGAAPALVLEHQGQGLFSGTASLKPGEELSYRVLLTAPAEQVELDAEDQPLAARTLRVPEGALTQRLTVERWGPEGGLTVPVVTFLVQVPGSTPAGAEIWISGNAEALGRWNGAGVKLAPTVDGRYAATLPFPPDTLLEYKVTRGGWATVEKGGTGGELQNRRLRTGSRSERAISIVRSWSDFVPPRQPTLTGTIQYLRNVTSQFPIRPRDVIIYLPPGYDANPTRRYPVLYMHDGQNVMDEITSFVGEWNADETAQNRILAGRVEPLIIVGVYNTTDRFPEYTQVVDPRYPELGGGKSPDYARFLVEELKPRIDSTYRTKPEPEFTGVAGSSAGGLASLYIALTYPNVFRRVGAVSPSTYWGNRDIIDRYNALPAKLPLKIWLDMGTEESTRSVDPLVDTRVMRDTLVAKGWGVGADLRYLEVQGGRHNEQYWSARFGDILEYLYPAQP
jgi:predicted alpha/beta superfamily hydrolase